MMILSIDPGTKMSAVVFLKDGVPVVHGKFDNEHVVMGLPKWIYDTLVIERIASYGMPVGAEVFDTVLWAGRFWQASTAPVHFLPRMKIKQHLCHSQKANDATIRCALIDRFGGREAAIGNKAKPGVLYGIKADVWAALAVAVTFADGVREA